ncbi:ATP-dependent protease, Lon family [Megamonas funiformis]|jgi:ATP-dependent Lon protease|uniref:Lon family ATP-dependent protease n=1 Tax=Megamonas funiformis TaxID=437897 RepID=UPI000E52FA8E|nr:Lon family ATP-dependent protease [Megamonas funiformis]RHG07942.1 ATP-dependent protease, Lon family [Megamonas funiformis]
MSIFSRFFKSKKKSRTTKAAVKLQQPNISATKVENSLEEIVVEPIDHDIDALYDILVDIEGADRLVLKASKLEALTLIRSNNRNQRILGLQKIVYENPTLDKLPKDDEIPTLLKEMMDYLANIMARRSFEDELEKRISAKMEENHQDYIFDIKKQILKEESSLKESSQSLAKLKQLEDKNKIHLTKSIMELLRPENLSEIIGQERAIKALKAKLSSPYPQHLILYGPPGVGKTTAARLVLQEACTQPHTPFNVDAPFVETDGTTLRYDPRGIANPLLGSVHDPIYQGARRDLADSGIPEPKPGLVTDAHGGILFIDEIGELDDTLQNELLKVLEDKRAYFDSAYFEPNDPNVPEYIKKLFTEGAPADFVLIGATTRDSYYLNPALRSRCAEIYFEPLTPKHIETIVLNAAHKLNAKLDDEVAQIISEYTIEGRKAINILADAYSNALVRQENDMDNILITKEDIYTVAQVSRLTPFITKKASDTSEIGKIFGLGVAGFIGSVIEIEAIAFKAHEKGKGILRFNQTAGSMAQDSVFNAAAVVRKLTNEDIHDYDIHINIIGGGNIDGPSAGTAILIALISAITQKPIRQDIAITGEISIQGLVRPVGGVFEKAYGASQAGIKTLIIPEENAKDIPPDLHGLKVHPVKTAQEALAFAFDKI